MRDIAKLLFGDGADDLFDQFGPCEEDGAGMAGRVSRAGEWCGSTPGRGSAAGAVRGVARPRGLRPEVIIREFRI
jgi:hypothetical protein